MRKNPRPNPGLDCSAIREMSPLRPLNFISIDPGDVHVGFASWSQSHPDHLEEMTPDQCLRAVAQMADTDWLELVVIEDWRLYPDMAAKMVGSDFPTCQMIGALKYILGEAGIAYHLQPAQAKYPTMGVMRSKKTRLVSQRIGCSNHVQDAELHGWFFQLEGWKQFEKDWEYDLRTPA